MIVLFTAGQLGNQIFQYSFLDKIKDKNEKIITSKCEYFNIFEYEKKNYIFFNKYIRYIIRIIISILLKFRIISYIKQNKEKLIDFEIFTNDYEHIKGLFNNIKVIDGFYQASNFVNTIPVIKEKYNIKANKYLDSIPKDCQKVFVHVRRGDYLDWNILGQENPSLPLSYYKSAIVRLQNELDNPFFIFLSNESTYIEKEFEYIEKKIISKNNVGVDIAIMKNCENAILSNSTLSWWGAKLMTNSYKVFGPKYWLGWQSNTWYPRGIKLDLLQYIKVRDK